MYKWTSPFFQLWFKVQLDEPTSQSVTLSRLFYFIVAQFFTFDHVLLTSPFHVWTNNARFILYSVWTILFTAVVCSMHVHSTNWWSVNPWFVKIGKLGLSWLNQIWFEQHTHLTPRTLSSRTTWIKPSIGFGLSLFFWNVPSSSRVALISASSCCCVKYTSGCFFPSDSGDNRLRNKSVRAHEWLWARKSGESLWTHNAPPEPAVRKILIE